MGINVDDLNPETRQQLGLRKTRETSFTKDDVRSCALKALAAVAHLTQRQRDRVLRHALKLNKV